MSVHRYEVGTPLSPAEKWVLALICGPEGMTAAQAATELEYSEETVKSFLRRIHQKTGTSGRAQLTRWAIGSGIVTIPGIEIHVAETDRVENLARVVKQRDKAEATLDRIAALYFDANGWPKHHEVLEALGSR